MKIEIEIVSFLLYNLFIVEKSKAYEKNITGNK
jgi:hypothetical protein